MNCTGSKWALVVTYMEPEEGMVVYGPFLFKDAAYAAWQTHRADFLNEGELPDDVTYWVKEMNQV